MTKHYQRYAIYWTPEPGTRFAAFGEQWFGPAREAFGLAPGLARRAAEKPARYTLHATLKAPFRLGEHANAESLQQSLDAFCATRRASCGGTLVLAPLQGYLSLVLTCRSADIDWLAAECVTHFDVFRAPLNDCDRDRRANSTLSGIEQAFLEAFGYPYVLSEFRFHISLAGPLGAEDLGEAAAALAPHLSLFMDQPMKIGSLSLLGEPCEGGVFELLSRHRFR